MLIDDLLATGGTAEAGNKLIERLGGKVLACAFIIDLPDLHGSKRLENLGMDIHALCHFDGDRPQYRLSKSQENIYNSDG